MSSIENEILVSPNFFVVAKHDFYLTDAKKSFESIGVEVVLANNLEDISEDIESCSDNCTVFVPHYSKIIDLNQFPQARFIGFHTGNLPKDRGGSPIQNKILQKEYCTRVSAIALEEKIDSGAIYTYRKVDLSEGDIDFILRKISLLISSMMVEIVLQDLKPIPQPENSEVKRRLSPSDSELPARADINSLYDRIRMVDGLDYPTAYIRQDNYKIYFTKAVKENGIISARAVFESSE